jgi:hypothetical protein
MIASSYSEAIENNLSRYITGKKCKHGHLSERYTRTRTCIACNNISSAKRIANNHEAQLERQRIWRLANPEKLKKASQNWLKNNQHKNAMKKRHRDASKMQRTPVWLNDGHKFEIECVYKYCSSLRSIHLKYEVDHIVPLQGKNVSGFHLPWNLQVITERENRSKSNLEIYHSSFS